MIARYVQEIYLFLMEKVDVKEKLEQPALLKTNLHFEIIKKWV